MVVSEVNFSGLLSTCALHLWVQQISHAQQNKLGHAISLMHGRVSHVVCVVSMKAVQVKVACTQDVLNVMEIGQRNRSVAETKMNERSSRSHSVLTIIVDGLNNVTGIRTHGCLHLIDLAGKASVYQFGFSDVEITISFQHAALVESTACKEAITALHEATSGVLSQLRDWMLCCAVLYSGLVTMWLLVA